MAIQVSQDGLRPKADVAASALKLLQFEADVRRCKSREELMFHMANQLTRLIAYDAAFVVLSYGRRKRKVVLSKDVSEIETSSPLIQAINSWASKQAPANQAGLFAAKDIIGNEQELPFEFAIWQPIQIEPKAEQEKTESAECFVLLFSDQAFSEQQQTLLSRLAETYEHALRAVTAKPKKLAMSARRKTFLKSLVLLSVVAVCAIPLPMSVMAPVEVIAKDPYVVTTPFNGVIKEVTVAANSFVNQGDVLVTFEDIQLRNEYLIELQRLAVAKANFEKIQGASFTKGDSKYELNVAKAELSLALVETRYRREQLERTQVRAAQSGLVIYGDKDDLEGKAVQVGERILQVAKPGRVQYRIELASGQAMAFEDGSPIAIYLDSAPLGGHEAKLSSVSYLPSVTQQGVASYTLLATPTAGQTPNIGARGTARIYAEKAPLIWHALRRPVNSIRQWLGV